MHKQNHLLAGLVTVLLIGVLSISGCVDDQIPPAAAGDGDSTVSVTTVTGTPDASIPTGGDTGAGLPLADVTSGTESITRYPGSVMLSHSTMTSPEGSYILVMYGTTASVGTVNSWYKDMLESAGWVFRMDYTEGTMKSITYNKEDTQDVVTINLDSAEGYTSILVTYIKTG